MQTPTKRNGSIGAPQRVSPRAVHQLKPAAVEVDSSSPSQTSRKVKEKSPKAVERKSPRSPASEKKRPSRISELENQVSQLQEDLNKARDELSLSESWKKQAQKEAEESKKQLSAMSLKLEESQRQLFELTASEEACIVELQKISQERDLAEQSELEALPKNSEFDWAALASSIDEIKHLKHQIERVTESENAQIKYAESTYSGLHSLNETLFEALTVVQNMNNQLKFLKEPEAQVQAFAKETLLQLETAKQSVETLRLDGVKAIEAHNAVALELEQSRKRVNALENLIRKLQADPNDISNSPLQKSGGQPDSLQATEEGQRPVEESDQLKTEIYNLKSEVRQLRLALDTADAKCHEDQIQGAVQIRSAYETVERIKSGSSAREAELEAMLKKTKADVEDLKANLMDKETELQGISEENEGLSLKLEKSLLSHRDSELERELKKLNDTVAELKANLMDKETELQNILEENAMLKSEMKRIEKDKGKDSIDIALEVQAARTAEREALVKLGIVMEEADKSNRRVARLTEQLEASQVANLEFEAELRKLKVQSDQWRKAAEAAAAMLSAGGNAKVVERTGSLDSNFNPVSGKVSLPYSDDMEDDLMKKKNGTMLKKIGVLWKKPHK